MNENFDGFLSHDMAVFGDPYRSGYATCAYSIVAPVLQNSSIEFHNLCEAEGRSMLRLLKPDTHLQVAWNITSDCSNVLIHYFDRTESGALSPFSRRERHERFVRYSKLMEARELRFERVCLYFSRPFSLKGGDPEKLLQAESDGFQALESELRNCFQRLGGRVERLTTQQIFAEQFRFCNPAQTEVPIYDPDHGLLMNCLTSEGNAVISNDGGFYMDDRYFGFLTLKSLPQATCAGLIQHLTALPICEFGITVNVVPLDTNREIEKEETEINRLRKSLPHGKQQRSVTTLDRRMRRVQRLASNEEVAFKAQILIRVWATDLPTLQAKLETLKSAITRMQMAKFFAPAFPTTARNYFRAAFPGWCWDSCQDFCHLIEDAPLSNLLPISGSPVLANAEALYDGANRNLIGVNSFINGAPQHLMVVGKTGSGKSALLIDLLSQTSADSAYTVIVDNGLSHETYCRVEDPAMRSLVITPNGTACFNYLDTGGEPLSPEHLVNAVSVAHEMAGRKADENADDKRRAVLSRCLNEFLTDHCHDWLRDDPERFRAVARYSVVLDQMDTDGQAQTLIERHRWFITWAESHEREAKRLLENVSESDIHSVSAERLRCLSFVFMSADQAPRHGQLQQWLELASMGDAPDREETSDLAIHLKAWCEEGGMYGPIFDGANNVNLNGRWVHIELGQISVAAHQLHRVAAVVTINRISNQIHRLPRNQRKRVVFEEVGSFLSFPGGEKIIREFFETMRKYNCWVVAVVQQVGILRECGASLLGNIRMAVLLKQSSPAEVELLGKLFELPESTRETLLRFPEPSRERGAPFLLWKSGVAFPEIVTGHHVASVEMLYVSSSSGDHHEARKNALAKYDDVLTGVIEEAAKIY